MISDCSLFLFILVPICLPLLLNGMHLRLTRQEGAERILYYEIIYLFIFWLVDSSSSLFTAC